MVGYVLLLSTWNPPALHNWLSFDTPFTFARQPLAPTVAPARWGVLGLDEDVGTGPDEAPVSFDRELCLWVGFDFQR